MLKEYVDLIWSSVSILFQFLTYIPDLCAVGELCVDLLRLYFFRTGELAQMDWSNSPGIVDEEMIRPIEWFSWFPFIKTSGNTKILHQPPFVIKTATG